MGREELENLVRIGLLQVEQFRVEKDEILMGRGRARLKDARRKELSLASRFDLAYNAAHALSLAALRRAGYRPKNRTTLFLSLTHVLKLDPHTLQNLVTAHATRNDAEYEGVIDLDEPLVDDLIAAAAAVEAALNP
jgi:hypothetical protein